MSTLCCSYLEPFNGSTKGRAHGRGKLVTIGTRAHLIDKLALILPPEGQVGLGR